MSSTSFVYSQEKKINLSNENYLFSHKYIIKSMETSEYSKMNENTFVFGFLVFIVESPREFVTFQLKEQFRSLLFDFHFFQLTFNYLFASCGLIIN